VRLLLDTHALLWFLDGDNQLAPRTAGMISDPANDVFVSSVSLWEITVKIRIGKLAANLLQIVNTISPSGFRLLNLKPEHLLELERLPLFADHKDPFDHLLMAQAIAENLTFISNDRNTHRYPVTHMTCSDQTGTA
jgi:PIN domain nuclease of toxin-antitoxin system